MARQGWGLEWHSKNQHGEDRHIIWPDGFSQGQPILFKTRAEAREFQQERFGYIRTRKDLRAEPHGWRMPKVVRVELELRRKGTAP